MSRTYVKILLVLLLLGVLFWAYRATAMAFYYRRKYNDLLDGVVAKDGAFDAKMQNAMCNLQNLNYSKLLTKDTTDSCEIGLIQLILTKKGKNVAATGKFDAVTLAALTATVPMVPVGSSNLNAFLSALNRIPNKA